MVDFLESTIINFDVINNRSFVADLGGAVNPAFVIRLKNYENRYLINSHLTARIIEWNRVDPVVKTIQDTFTVDVSKPNNSFNIAVRSPHRTFVGGTFRLNICGNASNETASLYTYSKEHGAKKIEIPNLKSSVGMVWNGDGTKMYHADACNDFVREYPYNLATKQFGKGFNFINQFYGLNVLRFC